MSRIKKSVKEEKREELLALAKAELANGSFHDITLDLLASKMGMSKSNLYHYFESKEQIYQEVFLNDLHDKAAVIVSRLEAIRGADDPEQVVAVLVDVAVRNKGLNDLGALFSTTLTRNTSQITTQVYQDRFNHAALMLTKAILVCLPTLDVLQVEEFIDYFIAFKNGLWADYSSTERYREIANGVSVRGTDTPFEKKLFRALMLMMKGLYAEKVSIPELAATKG